MSKDNIWFPFYINDWFGDTRHFDATQHGLYLLLVSEYWENRGPIKLNKVKLQKTAKLSTRLMNNSFPEVLELFIIEDGYIKHKRVDKELAKLADLKEKRSKGGRASAAKRREANDSTHVEHVNQESCNTMGGIACNSDSDCNSPLQAATITNNTHTGNYPPEIKPNSCQGNVVKGIF